MTTTVIAAAGTAGTATGTTSGTVGEWPKAEADFCEEVASEASFGNNRGGRGHVGRLGSVVVTVKGEVETLVRLAGGVFAVVQTGETTGQDVGDTAWQIVPATRLGIPDNVSQDHYHTGEPLRETAKNTLNGGLKLRNYGRSGQGDRAYARQPDVAYTWDGTVAADLEVRKVRGKRASARLQGSTESAFHDLVYKAWRYLTDSGKAAMKTRKVGRTGRKTRQKAREPDVTMAENNTVYTDQEKRMGRGKRVEKRLWKTTLRWWRKKQNQRLKKVD